MTIALLLLLKLANPVPLPDGPYIATRTSEFTAPVTMPAFGLIRIRGPYYGVRGPRVEGRAEWLPFGLLDVHYSGGVVPYSDQAVFTVHAVLSYCGRERGFEVLGFNYYETILSGR